MLLAFAAGRGFVCAQPAWAQDNGVGENAAANPGGNGGGETGGGHESPGSHVQWFGAAGPRWLTNSATRLAAPLRFLLRGAQRVSDHAASDLVRTGRSAISGPFNWIAGRTKAAPNDQDKAMAAVRSGEIVPLASVLKTVEKSVPGDVLNVSLTHDVVGSWNYTITVLTPQGYYRDVDVDAGKNNVTSVRPH